MSARRPVRRTRSAGGIVWRPATQAHALVDIVVCYRDATSVTCLPKGTPETGEKIEETAVREVQEETGLVVEPEHYLGSTSYWFATSAERIHKTVSWWLFRAVGGNVANHDAEFDRVEWMPANEAVARLTYSDERELVERALERIAGELAV